MIDYLLVFGLLVLLVVLSLPTMIQLAVAFGMDAAASSRGQLLKGIDAQSASQSRLAPAPVEPALVGRAAVEPGLAH